MIRTLLFISLFVLQLPVKADEGLAIVAIGKAQAEKQKMTFIRLPDSENWNQEEQKSMNEFVALLSNDFSFYKKYFDVVSADSLKALQGVPDYGYWQGRGFNIVSKVEFSKQGLPAFKITSWNIKTKEQIFEKTGILPSSKVREVGHEITDALYQRLTGKKSIFRSQILFVSDRSSTPKNSIKELYIMDFDGNNVRQLTHHRGTVISPAISYSGDKVLYSLIRERVKKRNINLYVMNLKSGKSSLISSRRGINSGAVFIPGDKEIALTLSHQGNAEIYIMNLETKKLRRLTRHHSPDVDPSINITGDRMTFLSGRPGKAMIYISDPRGLEKDIKRVSFVGMFNATPRFSPDGQEIAFSSWLDNRFDIFRIDSKGNNLSRLTKDFGSNEDPTYSNDGQFIAFSSQRVLSRRKAIQNIWIMDREGEIIGQVSRNFGNCITPRWSR